MQIDAFTVNRGVREGVDDFLDCRWIWSVRVIIICHPVSFDKDVSLVRISPHSRQVNVHVTVSITINPLIFPHVEQAIFVTIN